MSSLSCFYQSNYRKKNSSPSIVESIKLTSCLGGDGISRKCLWINRQPYDDPRDGSSSVDLMVRAVFEEKPLHNVRCFFSSTITCNYKRD